MCSGLFNPYYGIFRRMRIIITEVFLYTLSSRTQSTSGFSSAFDILYPLLSIIHFRSLNFIYLLSLSHKKIPNQYLQQFVVVIIFTACFPILATVRRLLSLYTEFHTNTCSRSFIHLSFVRSLNRTLTHTHTHPDRQTAG